MRRELETLSQELEALERSLSDPATLGDPQRYRQAAKRHAELKEVVDLYRRREALQRQADDARTLLGDPDLAEEARSEVEALSARLAAIDDELRRPRVADPQDAEQQEADRLAIRNAIMCCWMIEGRDTVIEGWIPIPPNGGCVGGVWTIQIRDAGCDCSNWES